MAARRLAPRGSLAALAALAHAACVGPPPAPPPPPAPRALAPAEVHLPPAARCARLDPPIPRPPPPLDTAPLSVQLGPGGVSLETSGAAAGRVLIAIAAATRQSMRVEGVGASVRIYAHVIDRPADTVIDTIARAAGLVIQRPPDAPIAVLDPAEAVREERSRRAARYDFAPLETRLVPARHAAEIAPVLARLLLGCNGEIVSAPRRGLLLVRDYIDTLNRMEALILALDNPRPLPIAMALDRPPGPITYGVPDATSPSCEAIPPDPAPPLDEGRLHAGGSAAGDLLRQIARARGRDIVVGCGGDRPVFFRGAPDLEPEEVAPFVGLTRLDPMTFTSEAMERAIRWQSMVLQRLREGPYLLRGFIAPDVEELAVAANPMLGSRGAAVVYAPASMLIAAGRAEDIAQVEALVEAWAAPDD